MAYIGAEPLPGQNREVDDISSSFNGSTTAFTLQVSSVNVSPESANNIIVSLGGVIQNPGTDYTIAASTITFTTAPASGLSFFGLLLGAGINTATVADQVITNAKVSNSAAIAGTKISPDFGSQNIVTTGGLTVDTTTLKVDTSNNRVGIGTASPAADLHINSSFPAIRLQDDSDYSQIDANSGTLRLSADAGGATANSEIAFFVDGTERMHINQDGRLIINHTASIGSGNVNSKLQIHGETSHRASASINRFVDGTGGSSFVLAKSRSGTIGTFTVVQENDTLGAIRFAAADGTDMNSTAAMIDSQIDGTPGSNDTPGRLRFLTTADGSDAPTERIRINKEGVTCIGTSTANTNGDTVTIAKGSGDLVSLSRTGTGNSRVLTISSGRATGGTTANMVVFDNASGTVVGTIQSNVSSTSFNTSSDYRLKENATAISDGITRLKTLKPYRFNFKDNVSKTVDGFFAHEVTAVPEAVTGTKDEVITQEMIDNDNAPKGSVGDPIYQGIDQSKLVPLLTAALQEAITKIETLETKVAALEAA